MTGRYSFLIPSWLHEKQNETGREIGRFLK